MVFTIRGLVRLQLISENYSRRLSIFRLFTQPGMGPACVKTRTFTAGQQARQLAGLAYLTRGSLPSNRRRLEC
ncbi:MAG TPA: hypothetical protein VN831_06790, partial [Bradyrhizobium sp.]|nr:hypothetical protein [Bradyrhizobium sp.]